MALAGFRQRPLKGDRISLEQLLIRPPQILLRSDYRPGQYSGEQRWLNHPLAKGTERSRTILTEGRPWPCMGPLLLDEIRSLRQGMAECTGVLPCCSFRGGPTLSCCRYWFGRGRW